MYSVLDRFSCNVIFDIAHIYLSITNVQPEDFGNYSCYMHFDIDGDEETIIKNSTTIIPGKLSVFQFVATMSVLIIC